jgi:hypothetical protein
MMESILRPLNMAFAMGWEILWPLIFGLAPIGNVELDQLILPDPANQLTCLFIFESSPACKNILFCP